MGPSVHVHSDAVYTIKNGREKNGCMILRLHPNVLPCKWEEGSFLPSIQTWKHRDFLTNAPIPTNTFSLKDISQVGWLWVFTSLSFLFSIFIILSPHMLFLSLSLPYCFPSSPCLSSSFTLSHRALCLLPQASCVYISVVYFYKCQAVFLPSVYWSTERRERGKER